MENLLNHTRASLADWLQSIGEARFRADQLFQWIHQEGVQDFAAMTNISKSLRANLEANTTFTQLPIISEQKASDGTVKWLFKVASGDAIETVFIPETGRGTLCVSSQVGCALNCSFCSTARQGFNGNLSVGEIIGQVYTAVRRLSQDGGKHDRQVTNVVMMGMGEPLLNFDPVVAAMDIMLDDLAYGLAKRRVTLSTSGVVPEMWRLKNLSPVALAVSLHAATDELRDILVPLNKKYPLAQLMAVCREYFKGESKRTITFEYVMLAGVNDQPQHAKALIRLLQGISGKVNLIPFNPFPQAEFTCSDMETIELFKNRLSRSGIIATIRKMRGDDIDAACGQLAGEVSSKAKRQHHIASKLRKIPIIQAQIDAASDRSA